jgi:hypothetical protein
VDVLTAALIVRIAVVEHRNQQSHRDLC